MNAALPIVFFDGRCGFCTRFADWAKTRARVTVRPWQAGGFQRHGLTRAQVRGSIWFVDPDGTSVHAHLAFARVLQRCGGALAFLGRVIAMAPVRWGAAATYRVVKRMRSHLPGTTPALKRGDATPVEREGVPEVVVVGGGFGGLQVARRLQRADVRVTLVDRRNHHLFQPLLYQVATAGLPGTSIATPIRHVLSPRRCRVLLGEVTDVDLSNRFVQLRDGQTLSYDYLVLAAGAETSWFGHDEWSQHALGMKDMRDAVVLRERLLLAFERAERSTDIAERRRLLTFVVVGGGATGVELAGAIAELGRRALSDEYQSIEARDIRIVMAEMGDRLLSSFHPELSRRAKDDLERLGVEVWLEARVIGVEPSGVRVETPSGARMIEAGTVSWAPGVRPVELAEKLPVRRTGGRIEVDETCAIPGHKEVFCIGDLAHFVPSEKGKDRSEEPLPGLAAVAMQQGAYVAKSIRREVEGGARKPFHYRNKGTMATIGRGRAIVEWRRVRFAGPLAWLLWSLAHIFLLIGFRNRVVVFLDWVFQYVTWRRGARLIMGVDPLARVSMEGRLGVSSEGASSASEARPRQRLGELGAVDLSSSNDDRRSGDGDRVWRR